MMKTINKSI